MRTRNGRLAGALVPRRFGQGLATVSSIILTTVTDVAGFFTMSASFTN
ncbi:MAG: hypothetical protein M3Y32_00680 [Pseudomonadota bacterium]|nr:hypothetical protein [Pseudomonadota bacterium]